MMPSRGIHFAKGCAPRLYQLQCRNLSSASRRISPPILQRFTRSPVRPTAWHATTAALPVTVCLSRHASTTPTSAPPLVDPPPEPAAATTTTASNSPPLDQNTFPNLDTISLDGIDLDPVANVPEGIGYLHTIGIDYGYGPTSMVQWTIEHLHILGGLPWWGSIAATAVLLRVVMFPLYLKSSDSMARSMALSSITQPISKKMEAARKAGDQQAMMESMQELMAVRRQGGLSLRSQFTPMIIQGVVAYCGFRLISAMVRLPVPAFKTEGPLWLQDLTLSDPYLILPIVMAGSIHLLVRMGGETGAATQNTLNPAFQKAMLYGMPVFVCGVMGFQSGALCIWFAAGGAMGILQSILLRRPEVRRFFGIAPLYTPTKDEADSGMAMAFLNRSSSPTPTASTTSAMGKHATFMNPTYQAPNLRRAPPPNRGASSRQPAGDVLDVKGSSRGAEDEMIQPDSPGQGVLGEVSKAWSSAQKRQQQQPQQQQQSDNLIDVKPSGKAQTANKAAGGHGKTRQRKRGGR